MRIEKVNTLKGAKLALSNRLFVNGWLLGYELTNITENVFSSSNYEIWIAFKDAVPVGIGLKKQLMKANKLMVFVRKKYRNRGIGRKIVNLMKDDRSYGLVGIKKANGKIYKLNGIRLKNYL